MQHFTRSISSNAAYNEEWRIEDTVQIEKPRFRGLVRLSRVLCEMVGFVMPFLLVLEIVFLCTLGWGPALHLATTFLLFHIWFFTDMISGFFGAIITPQKRLRLEVSNPFFIRKVNQIWLQQTTRTHDFFLFLGGRFADFLTRRILYWYAKHFNRNHILPEGKWQRRMLNFADYQRFEKERLLSQYGTIYEQALEMEGKQ